MCGLFGAYSSSLSDYEIEHVQFLGLLSTTRGIDSTGIAVLGRETKNNKTRITYDIHRKVDDFLSFMKDKEAHDIFKLKDRFAVLGHTRWATLGAVNKHNAHPIREGNILLCHNGSVDHFCKNPKDEKDSDSREIARRLNKGSLKQTILDIRNGHFAMTYVDFQRGTLNITRNQERPLAFMWNTNKTSIYWASLPWMLTAMKAKFPYGFDDINLLATGVNYQFKLGTMDRQVIKLFEKSKNKPVDVKKPTGRLFAPMFCPDCKNKSELCTCKTAVPVLPPPQARPPVSTTYQGYNGARFTIAAILPFVNKGCACCQEKGLVTNVLMWFDPKSFICMSCYENDPEVKQHMRQQMKFSPGYALVHKDGVWKRVGEKNA